MSDWNGTRQRKLVARFGPIERESITIIKERERFDTVSRRILASYMHYAYVYVYVYIYIRGLRNWVGQKLKLIRLCSSTARTKIRALRKRVRETERGRRRRERQSRKFISISRRADRSRWFTRDCNGTTRGARASPSDERGARVKLVGETRNTDRQRTGYK